MDLEQDFESICRTCLSYSKEVQPIFDVHISGAHTTYMTDFLHQITSLKYIKGDGLPENICIMCIEQLCSAFNFSRSCVESDNTLRLYSQRKLLESDHPNALETEKLSNTLVENLDCDSNLLETNKEEKSPNVKAKEKFYCANCPKCFSSRKTLNKHMRQHEITNYPHKCEQCSQGFLKRIHLNMHMKSHKNPDEKQFKCDECKQTFNYLYLLKQHSYKHKKEKPFPCSKCEKGCLTAESLKRHMKIHDENYTKKVHQCSICQKEFPYRSFLAEHMKNHTGEKPFLCSMCGKGFRQSGALEYHMRSHMGVKPFTCNVCQNNFMSRGVLRVHMRRHTNERPYSCDLCGMAFRQSTDMKSHRRTHTGDKPVLCPVCGKRMSTTGQLTVHLRSHTGEKPFPCTICQKAFTTRTMLVKHVRIHTGERPYMCNICGRCFNQSSTLKTHSRIHRKQDLDEDSEKIKLYSGDNRNDMIMEGFSVDEQITIVNVEQMEGQVVGVVQEVIVGNENVLISS